MVSPFFVLGSLGMSSNPASALPELSEPKSLREATRAVWARRGILIALAIVPGFAHWFSPKEALFLYPYTGCIQVLSAGFCVAAGFRKPEQRLRWWALAMAQILAGTTYLIAVANLRHSISDEMDVLGRNITLAGSRVLLIPALMVARTRSGRVVRGLDVGLALLVCVLLSWALALGEPAGGVPRLWVGFASLVLVTLAALAAWPSSDTPSHRQFTETMVVYLSSATLANFLINIVFYMCFHADFTWPAMLLMCVAPLLLCEWSLRPGSRTMKRFPYGLDRNVVDSLQPTLMLLGCTLLGVYLVQHFPRIGGAAMLVAVLLYLLRTQAFYYRLFRERSQLRNEASHLQALAASDALTGIGNRRWFEQNAAALLQDDPSSRMTLMLIDADEFKEVNDRFGHFVGDEMLRHVADVMRDVIDTVPRACCARLGGDEFAAMLPGISMEQATAIAEAICRGIRAAGNVKVPVESAVFEVGLQPTVSVGMACLNNQRVSLPLLMRWADAALYRAKDDGRNCVRVINLAKVENPTALEVVDAVPKIGREPMVRAADQPGS